MGKYFDIASLCRSNTATANKIDNTPKGVHKTNMINFINNVLDPLREDWGKYCAEKKLGSPGINISSGYRCPELNKKVGGSATSQHSHGQAADMSPANGRIAEFKKFVFKWLYEKHYGGNKKFFHQVISEGQLDTNINSKPRWIHIGAGGNNKGNFMYAKDKDGKWGGSVGGSVCFSLSAVKNYINDVNIGNLSGPSSSGSTFHEPSETSNATTATANVLRIDKSKEVVSTLIVDDPNEYIKAVQAQQAADKETASTPAATDNTPKDNINDVIADPDEYLKYLEETNKTTTNTDTNKK